MRYHYSISVIASFLVFSSVYSQSDSITLIIEIQDKTYHETIQNVQGTFVFGQTTLYAKSTSKGKIALKIPQNCSLIFSLNHPVYEPFSASRKISSKTSDSLTISVDLIPIKSQFLKEIVVKSPGVPDTVFESNRLSVADFEIQRDGKLILLTYPKQLKKGCELLLYDGLEVLNSFSVPGIAEELVHDYRGNTHIVCKENVFGIHLNKERIGISTLEKNYFFKYLAPILDTNKSKMFFSNFKKEYPAFDYYAYDQEDSTYLKIVEIKDDLMMELYRSEYKWVDVRTKLWAKNKEIETGVDAEIWVGANFFTQSIYYKELYAPLFYRNDSIFVFDYYTDKLLVFDGRGEKIDSISIYHHYQPKASGWSKQLIQDRITGEIYAVYDKAGFTFLGLIDTKTGEIKEKVKLEFRYIDKLEVHNNFVYYVYRPFESTQKKFLYKERLPYDFKKAAVLYGTETSMETGK